ncbi:MAG: hypothetical protein RL160_588 [Bacteroidota bacterium]|jgi:hypothetical protein
MKDTTDRLRNSIIQKILSISDRTYLETLHQLIENSSGSLNHVQLNEQQIALLKMSEQDIKNGNTITQNDLDKHDMLWLKDL